MMRVLHARELEVALPVRALLGERRRAVADLDPLERAVVGAARGLHVAEVFAFGDGTAAEGAAVDRVEHGAGEAGFELGADEVAHAVVLP